MKSLIAILMAATLGNANAHSDTSAQESLDIARAAASLCGHYESQEERHACVDRELERHGQSHHLVDSALQYAEFSPLASDEVKMVARILGLVRE